jgi:hypothetical protein
MRFALQRDAYNKQAKKMPLLLKSISVKNQIKTDCWDEIKQHFHYQTPHALHSIFLQTDSEM